MVQCDLHNDVAEKTDVAAQHPEILANHRRFISRRPAASRPTGSRTNPAAKSEEVAAHA